MNARRGRLGRALFVVALAAASQDFATSPACATVWPNELERLEADLKLDRDVETRRAAAQRLLHAPRVAARRLLKGALNDPDPLVRVALGAAALLTQTRDVGQSVVPWLTDVDRDVRLMAAQLLATSPHRDAVSPLGRLLLDPEPVVRVAAARALGASTDPGASLALLGHLDDPQAEVRSAVITALERLRDPRAVVPLLRKLSDSSPGVRQRAVHALGTLGDLRAAGALLQALADAEPAVRAAALTALGRLGAPDTVGAVVHLLRQETDATVRDAAVHSLSELGDRAALTALVDVVRGADGDISRRAGDLLGRRGSAALEPLAHCVTTERSEEGRGRCVLALGTAGVPEALPLIEHELQVGTVDAATALVALAKLGDVRALTLALEYVSAPDVQIRRAAMEAVGALLDPEKPDGRAVAPLERALAAPKLGSHERRSLVRLLGRTGSRNAAGTLRAFVIHSDDSATRVTAIRALGELGPTGSVDSLLEATNAPEPEVREAAVLAIRRAGDGAAVPVLIAELRRSAATRRVLVARALLGPLSRSQDPDTLTQLHPVLLASRGKERDALLEAIAASPNSGALREISLFARDPVASVRGKVAEVLASRNDAEPWLLRLADDGDASVRANAIWSLGQVGGTGVVARLARASRENDVAISGNAVAALALTSRRTSRDATPDLCAALERSHPYVRVNALAGLRLLGARCSTRERWLLENDPSPDVRAAAALLVGSVASTDEDRFALDRCRLEDTSGEVALACLEPRALPSRATRVSVQIVAPGDQKPTPRTAFALLRADGTIRMGQSDSQGSVYEPSMPSGTVRLRVPAPLVR